jgi:outer membrane protein assembly factor BamD
MRTKIFASGALLVTILAAGCSSGPLPSLPSMPWSSSAPAVDPTAEALFAEGTRYFNEKRYVRAIDAFMKLKTEHPFSPLLSETELKIADAYYLNQQYPDAVNALKEFQTLHPTSEQIPFVILRLGQAHFNEFTNVNRDQKNTEIAKGYFEAVLANYPKSPHAAEAREKLAKCNGILAEHDFNIAEFYFKQEKYPAARDRFEEILRRYPGTPVASRSLFFLGESYRKEKNNVKASLAFEALLQHYPDDRFAPAARTQLAQIEKDKQDPLAMLLMRDRRPAAAPAAPEAKPESPAIAKPKQANNLVAKTEVVYEAPGDEKGMFSRVVAKINPFASGGSEKKPEEKTEEKKNDQVLERLASKNKSDKEGSKGFFSSLWPFGGSDAKTTKATTDNNGGLVAGIDDSLKQRGIDVTAQTASLKTPEIDLPNVDDLKPKQQATDTAKLLGQIDANLKKDGKASVELPPPPEAAPIFKDAEAAQAAIAKAQPKTEAEQKVATSSLLSTIDQKLKGRGVEPANFEPVPPMPADNQPQAKPAAPREINLEPKRVTEKGPLFLSPGMAPDIDQTAPAPENAQKETPKTESVTKPEEPGVRAIPKALVRGPQQPKPESPAAKPAEAKSPSAAGEEEIKGPFDQLKQDLQNASKVLNPFSW